MATITTQQDIDDFVRGTTLFGTGGGGNPKAGKALLLESLQAGKTICWTDIDTMNDDDWVCTSLYMGSIAPLTEEDLRWKASLGLNKRVELHIQAAAVRELEREMGITFAGIIPVELGGSNSPAALDAAIQTGKKLIDGDLSGRAVPEVSQTLPRIGEYPICPIACCDSWGNVILIRKTHGYDNAEALGKMLSIPAFESIGLACFAMKVRDLKNHMVKKTMTRSLACGAMVRKAREAGQDPAQAFAEAAGGNVVFRGDVREHNWESKGGYMIGTNVFKGTDAYRGKELKIWFKNENHISWIDGKAYITSPDILEVVDGTTGEPITNTDIAAKMHVAVVAVPNPIYRSAKGLDLMGPTHYGFDDIQYVPMEELVR